MWENAAAKSLQSCPTLCEPHRQQPIRLPRPWDSPGKNTGVGCHSFLHCVKVKSESEVGQSCLTHGDPIDCSLPGSSVHGIFQARLLEWGAIAFSGLPWQLSFNWWFVWRSKALAYLLEDEITADNFIGVAFRYGSFYLYLFLGISEDAFNTNNHIGLNDKEVYACTCKGSRGRVASGLFIQVLKCWHWEARMFSILFSSL